jgi:hypothetical protein
MPVTSLEILQSDGSAKRLQFITEQHETGLFVGVRQCDEDWNPFGEPAETVDHRLEEVYHKELRAAAKEKNQFVAQYSTNPEWNPGYIPQEDGNQDTLQSNLPE